LRSRRASEARAAPALSRTRKPIEHCGAFRRVEHERRLGAEAADLADAPRKGREPDPVVYGTTGLLAFCREEMPACKKELLPLLEQYSKKQ